jgi:hypothetical protein
MKVHDSFTSEIGLAHSLRVGDHVYRADYLSRASSYQIQSFPL